MPIDNEFDPNEFDPTINVHALDREWEGQPNLYYKYAVLAQDARRRVDEAKASVELTKAELARLIAANPAEFNLSKTTESAIAGAVLEQTEYKTELRALHKAQHTAGLLGVVLTTLEHRRRALENLVELHMNNYFSAPTPKGEGGEAVKQAEKNAQRRRAARGSIDELPE